MRRTLIEDHHGHIDYLEDKDGFLMIEIYKGEELIAYLGAKIWDKLVSEVNRYRGLNEPYAPKLITQDEE